MSTPNMGLNLPQVGITSGPLYAQDVNDAFTTVDQHDHTSGSGVPIPAAALNINADLNFNYNGLLNVFKINFEGLGSTLSPTFKQTLYAVDQGAGGVNLFYNDGSGAAVQLTKYSSGVTTLNVSSSGIKTTVGPNTYEAWIPTSTLVVQQTAGTGTGNKLPIHVNSVLLSPAGSTYKVTLKTVDPLPNDLSITLPVPNSSLNPYIVTIDNQGNLVSENPNWIGTTAGFNDTGADAIASKILNNNLSSNIGFTALAANISSNNAAILVTKVATADLTPVNYRNPAGDAVAAAMSSTGTTSIAATITTANANTIVGKTNGSLVMPTSSANVIGTAMDSTGANAVAASRTRSIITNGIGTSAGQIVYASAVTTFVTTNTSFQNVPNQTITIVTNGRPLVLGVGTSGGAWMGFSLDTGEVAIVRTTAGGAQLSVPYIGSPTTVFNLVSFESLAAGTYYFRLLIRSVVGYNAAANNVRLYAYEL